MSLIRLPNSTSETPQLCQFYRVIYQRFPRRTPAAEALYPFPALQPYSVYIYTYIKVCTCTQSGVSSSIFWNYNICCFRPPFHPPPLTTIILPRWHGRVCSRQTIIPLNTKDHRLCAVSIAFIRKIFLRRLSGRGTYARPTAPKSFLACDYNRNVQYV